jgi:hypothetical protein
MIIRESQLRSLEQACQTSFETRMVERIRTYFPKHAQLLSDPQLIAIIRLADRRAQTHILTTERSVAMYLDLMCLLGSGFDEDPQIPWAAKMLRDRLLPTQDERMDQLHVRGWEFARRASEDFKELVEKGDSSRFRVAIGYIRRKDTANLTAETARALEGEIRAQLRELFPVKSSLIGEDCLRALVTKAFQSAFSNGIRNARGVSLFAALMFTVGAGFDRDPMLPWALDVLVTHPDPDPVTRTNRLFSEALRALKAWWSIDMGEKA